VTAARRSGATAALSGITSGVQSYGVWSGYRQLFVRFAGEVFKPLVFFVFSIPKSIFLPMFILAFGISFWQKVAFGVFSTIFIVMMTAFAAVASVRHEHLLTARSVRRRPPAGTRR
jgi:ABC-type nitrate/sulfonate/bicarbonate transport system permease component